MKLVKMGVINFNGCINEVLNYNHKALKEDEEEYNRVVQQEIVPNAKAVIAAMIKDFDETKTYVKVEAFPMIEMLITYTDGTFALKSGTPADINGPGVTLKMNEEENYFEMMAEEIGEEPSIIGTAKIVRLLDTTKFVTVVNTIGEEDVEDYAEDLTEEQKATLKEYTDVIECGPVVFKTEDELGSYYEIEGISGGRHRFVYMPKETIANPVKNYFWVLPLAYKQRAIEISGEEDPMVFVPETKGLPLLVVKDQYSNLIPLGITVEQILPE